MDQTGIPSSFVNNDNDVDRGGVEQMNNVDVSATATTSAMVRHHNNICASCVYFMNKSIHKIITNNQNEGDIMRNNSVLH